MINGQNIDGTTSPITVPALGSGADPTITTDKLTYPRGDDIYISVTDGVEDMTMRMTLDDTNTVVLAAPGEAQIVNGSWQNDQTIGCLLYTSPSPRDRG